VKPWASDSGPAREIFRLCGGLCNGSPAAKSILVTGPEGGEGVTTAAIMLATGLAARSDRPVLLIEANLHTPGIHRLLDVGAEPGLAGWSGEGPLPYQRCAEHPNLAILTAGLRASLNGAGPGLTDMPWLGVLARRARDEFAYVIWDTAPALRYPDVAMLSPLTDGVLVMVEADRTRLDQLSYLREQMQRVNATLLGAVMNRHGRYWPFTQ